MITNPNTLGIFEREIKEVCTAAAEYAKESPEPDPLELYTDVLVKN